MKKKLISLLVVLLLVLTLPLPSYADYQAITIDGHYEDWYDKPHSDIWHGNDNPSDYNQVSLFRDESTLYVHVVFSETENYMFETTKMTIKTNIGNQNLWFKPDYAGGYFSKLETGTEDYFWPAIEVIVSAGGGVDLLQDYISFYLFLINMFDEFGDLSEGNFADPNTVLEQLGESMNGESQKKMSQELDKISQELEDVVLDLEEEQLTETPDEETNSSEITETAEPDRGGLLGRVDETEKKDKEKDTPVEEPPAETPPAAEEPPAETPPAAEEPPAETPPAAEEPPAETPPAAEEPPAETPPAAEEPPAEEGSPSETTNEPITTEETKETTDAAVEAEILEEAESSSSSEEEDWIFILPLKVTETQGGSSSVGSGFYTISYDGGEYFYNAEFAIPLSAIHNPADGMKEIEMKIPLLGKQWFSCVGTSTAPFIIAGIGALMVFGTYGYVNYKKRRLSHSGVKGQE
ncbi:MAG: hypothetical protein PHQ50_00955 [Eubacteriales bacterium]|nr:hypothetical protein [Eubacteriales bacterium]MDD3349723.1 hypothetical protein [Eubacteriales bacterium]